jgi:GDPmannose 4,6-dehydratase
LENRLFLALPHASSHIRATPLESIRMTPPPIAAIFGVSGQDGAYLSHLLLSKGYQVHGISRDAGATSFDRLARLGIQDRVTLHSGNLSEFRSILFLLDKIQPTEIYNLAGQSSVALSFELPVETFESVAVGAINVLDYLRQVKRPARYFQSVSSDCFGNTLTPANESTPFQPRSPYSLAKASAFWTSSIYREAYGLHVCSGILSNHESPLRPQRFVTRKIVSTAVRIAQGSKERLKLGNIDIARDWGWAPEYVEAIWRLLRQDTPSDLVIATGKTQTLRQFAQSVFAELGLELEAHLDADASLLRPTEVARTELDVTRAREELGWSAKSVLAGVTKNLVACELTGQLGPLPWVDGPVPDQRPA